MESIDPVDRLRALMDEERWSCAHVARACGCDPSLIQKILKRQRRMHGLELALALEALTGGRILAREWADHAASVTAPGRAAEGT